MPGARWDVLVAGGGPAGAWTARLLAERGWSVALWDRERFPRDKPCGEYLSPGAVALMRAGGAGGALDALAPAPISGARIFTARGDSFGGAFRAENGVGLSVRRTRLDAALLGLAAESGACIFEGRALRSFAWGDGVIRVSGREGVDSVETTCRLLVGADGGHSMVARRMDGVRPIRRLQKVAFVTHARRIAGLEGRVEMHAGLNGCVGIGPGPEDMANVTVVMPSAEARLVRDVPASVRETVERYPGLRGRFDNAAWDGQVLRVGTFGHTVSTAVADGVLLVGDSAAFIDPFTGEGVYFALRGAEMAADAADRALREGAATVAALAPYERARRREFDAKFALCSAVERVVGVPGVLGYMAGRFRKHPALADDLIRATGDILPPGRVFSVAFWARLLT